MWSLYYGWCIFLKKVYKTEVLNILHHHVFLLFSCIPILNVTTEINIEFNSNI